MCRTNLYLLTKNPIDDVDSYSAARRRCAKLYWEGSELPLRSAALANAFSSQTGSSVVSMADIF